MTCVSKPVICLDNNLQDVCRKFAYVGTIVETNYTMVFQQRHGSACERSSIALSSKNQERNSSFMCCTLHALCTRASDISISRNIGDQR